jgi:hypothetical protein
VALILQGGIPESKMYKMDRAWRCRYEARFRSAESYLLDVAAGPDPGGVLIETWGRTHVVIPIGTEPVVPGRYGRGDSRAVRLRYRFSC